MGDSALFQIVLRTNECQTKASKSSGGGSIASKGNWSELRLTTVTSFSPFLLESTFVSFTFLIGAQGIGAYVLFMVPPTSKRKLVQENVFNL